SVGVVGMMIPSPIAPCTSEIFSSTVSSPTRNRTVGVQGGEAAGGCDDEEVRDGDNAACAPTADTMLKPAATITARRILMVFDELLSEWGGWHGITGGLGVGPRLGLDPPCSRVGGGS